MPYQTNLSVSQEYWTEFGLCGNLGNTTILKCHHCSTNIFIQTYPNPLYVCVCLSDSGKLEKKLEDVTLARRDLEDSSKHVKTLEKQMRSLTQDKDDMQKVCVCLSVWISDFFVFIFTLHTSSSAGNIICSYSKYYQ